MLAIWDIHDFQRSSLLSVKLGQLTSQDQYRKWVVILPLAMNNLKEELLGANSFYDKLKFEEKGNSDGDWKRCHCHPHMHLVLWYTFVFLLTPDWHWGRNHAETLKATLVMSYQKVMGPSGFPKPTSLASSPPWFSQFYRAYIKKDCIVFLCSG